MQFIFQLFINNIQIQLNLSTQQADNELYKRFKKILCFATKFHLFHLYADYYKTTMEISKNA